MIIYNLFFDYIVQVLNDTILLKEVIVLNVTERIKSLLDERGWTIYKLSQMSGVSHSTITNIFERNTAPTIPTLEAICRGFNISLAQFFHCGEENSILSCDEKELLLKWNSLNDRQRKAFVTLMDSILGEDKP